MKRLTTSLLAVLVLAVAQPGAAHAQVGAVGEGCSVTQDAYGPGICPPPPEGDPPVGDRLPFTGAEAGIAGGAGLLLLLIGLGMRRAAREQEPPPA